MLLTSFSLESVSSGYNIDMVWYSKLLFEIKKKGEQNRCVRYLDFKFFFTALLTMEIEILGF